ncbi:MAG: hypothetical protein UR68_C0005G0002 [Candidatus Roizmanbacteria bacterium GW2011_GWA2_35_19]|uniref:Uncharacterized protein n=2 Tax=Candidatus Roizmaniibacteriota TaxID=1752723 RepID=A0A0G0BVF7_9BACT|nr:MAG: hypothetical protein UR63_C0028G0002 [Candidatus Roizmanbacteria bacterium GW2011_GWC2_35_12]KKP73268.1 MAG: hypothetical protein UR68_C0005G0002 [Candidatus Roizmanbacteria bacterium GW2011_GWA2_35_19]
MAEKATCDFRLTDALQRKEKWFSIGSVIHFLLWRSDKQAREKGLINGQICMVRTLHNGGMPTVCNRLTDSTSTCPTAQEAIKEVNAEFPQI